MSQSESQLFLLVSLGVFGLLFGSFANVVIWRLPRRESLSVPGSHCPRCDQPIRWYDNIPVVSWLILRARCRDCGAWISWRYPAVETLSSLLWVLAGLRFGLDFRTAAAVFLFYVLLLLSFIDIDTMRLPNPLVALLAIVGLVAAVVSQLLGIQVAPLVGVAEQGWASQTLLSALAGSAVGGGLLAASGAIYTVVRKRKGLGFGDVKLLAALGPFLGLYVLLDMFAASAIFIVWASVYGAVTRRSVATARLPFGPFVAIGGIISVMGGPELWRWYLSMIGVS